MSSIIIYAVLFAASLTMRFEYKEESKRIKITSRSKPSVLEIWVEAKGHINFSITMESERKGLYGIVLFDGTPVTNWLVTQIPLNEKTVTAAKPAVSDNMPGGEQPGGHIGEQQRRSMSRATEQELAVAAVMPTERVGADWPGCIALRRP